MSTLWLRHTPRTPCPQSSNYIHSPLRLSGSRGSNSVHLSLRTGYDSNDRTSCVFQLFSSFLFFIFFSFSVCLSLAGFFLPFSLFLLCSFSLSLFYFTSIQFGSFFAIYLVEADHSRKSIYLCTYICHMYMCVHMSVFVLRSMVTLFHFYARTLWISATSRCIAARDWNGTSEFPRACYRMLLPSEPQRTGIKFLDNSDAGSICVWPGQCRAS